MNKKSRGSIEKEAITQKRLIESNEQKEQRQQRDRESYTQRRLIESNEQKEQRQQRDRESHTQRIVIESEEQTRQRQQRDCKSYAKRFRNETEEESAQRRQNRQQYTSQWRAQQAENTILQIQAEDDQDFSNEDVINQFEENYEEDVFPHEQRRKFGEPGDIFYACEHCGALKMKKSQGLRYAKGEDKPCF